MYAFVGKLLLERLDELCHQLLAVPFRALELVGDCSVLLGIGVAEVYVLHLALYVVQTQLVGKGNVEHHCLQNLPFAGEFREHIERAHNLQTVSYLKHRDAWIT